MTRRSVLIFIASLITFYVAIQTFSRHLVNTQEKKDARQARIILENVKDRFKLFMRLPLNIGVIGADFFSKGEGRREGYDIFNNELVVNPEILGLNLLNVDGKIIKVFPLNKNSTAVGKTTQNLQNLKKSLARKEGFWFSPPFKLFQGKYGFVFYVPIFENNVLRGWFAPVLSTEQFIMHFKLREFLSSYELSIKDQITGRTYISTATIPESGPGLYEAEEQIYGRNLIFQTWRKNRDEVFAYIWYWNLLISAIIASVITQLFRLYEQKRKTRRQLKEISVLLKMTSKEALNNLVEFQSQIGPGSKENVNYLTNLIEQIDLLQTMTQTGEGLDEEKKNFGVLLSEKIEGFADTLQKKNLKINFDINELKKVFIGANSWLIQNTVLNNVLAHLLIHTRMGSVIDVEHTRSDKMNFITFHSHQLNDLNEQNSVLWDRRIDVANKALHIFGGELDVQKDMSSGMIVRIKLPV